jgi:hypothetical protein
MSAAAGTVALAAAPTADAQGRPAILASGKTFVGQFVAADAEGRLTFRSSGERGPLTETIPAEQLVRWGQFVESSHGAQILLADGGLLVAQLTAIDREKLTARSELFGDVALPAGAALAVIVHPPADPHRRDRLVARLLGGDDRTDLNSADVERARGDAPAADARDKSAPDKVVADRVFLDNGDELLGTIALWHDDTLSVETDAGRVDLEAAQITALQLRQKAPDRPAPGRVLIVGWRDGSRLVAGALLADARQARLTLAPAAPGGEKAEPITLTAATAAITGLQTLGGQAVYLSDLKPVGYKHIPFLQLAWPYRTDRNVSGDLLRAGGKLYLKGLGMHSASRLTYDLDRPASRFEAALAIDDRAGGRGSVVFRVFVDTGEGHWEPKFTSPTVRGGDAPLSIAVDVARAKRISLLVEFADRGDQLDYADWLDARLVP